MKIWITAVSLACAVLVSFDAYAAFALSCGDTVGPGGHVTLDTNIGPCAGPEPALTVVGPVTLDMRNHRISCAGVSDGIFVQGRRAIIEQGTVEGCVDGVRLAGQGWHRLENLVVQNNSFVGVQVESDGNTLKRLVVTSNSLGVRGGDVSRNKLINSVVSDNSSGVGFGGIATRTRLVGNWVANNQNINLAVQGNGNLVYGNSSAGARFGIEVDGLGNRIVKNVATGASLEGIVVGSNARRDGKGNFVARNASVGNRLGFFVEGWNHRVRGNVASGNSGNGYNLYIKNALIRDNRAEGCGGVGFQLFLSESLVERNFASENGDDGMSFANYFDFAPNETRQRVRKNVVLNNGGVGLRFLADTELNSISRNVAFENATSDLADENASCGTNEWSQNSFASAGQGCIE